MDFDNNVAPAAFFQGKADYRIGIKVGNNPWTEDDDRHWRWMQGWAEAAIEARRRNPALCSAPRRATSHHPGAPT